MIIHFGTPALRILYVNATAGLGGAERVLLDLMKACRTALPQAKITLVLFEDGPLRQLAAQFVDEILVLPLPDRWAHLGDVGLSQTSPLQSIFYLGKHTLLGTFSLGKWGRDLRRIVSNLRPDIVHTNGIKAHLLTSLATPRSASIVWHLHDFLGDRRMAKHLLRLAAPRLTLGLAISEAVKKDFERSVGSRIVEVFPNTVDTEKFTPQVEGDARIRLGELSGCVNRGGGRAVNVGLIATYANWKGHFLFLDAIAECKRRTPRLHARYFIIGGPIYRTHNSQVTRGQLERYVVNLGLQQDVAFVPFQDAMPEIYSGLDVVVHASIRPEPFGLAILEGMASGKAVISTALGGAAEVFQNDVEGIALSACDADSLSAALRRVVGDKILRTELGQHARMAAVERFNQNQLPERLRAIYLKLLSCAMSSLSNLDYSSKNRGHR
ncbi:glycosyltransferase family 4 protein [Blastopirellula marina]|uniref:Glycosyl transferase, group 1 family protein n=1 Tax=Blastopirellula marina DSM 3645 TaxID=314230 RepID=A3ZP81_9BACT|nr:glycosyltransferase family 4 protein [Blastopirellula marina]EAQ81559.1 glycosyl transferase, group 1 family protein [Blastopirellula marina DSM 3645]